MKDHDLSYQKTTLNFDRLLKVANIATSYSKQACERSLRELQVASVRDMKYAAKRLAECSVDLACATDTLYVLQEARDRNELIIDRTN